jgi:hypothetical protein
MIRAHLSQFPMSTLVVVNEQLPQTGTRINCYSVDLSLAAIALALCQKVIIRPRGLRLDAHDSPRPRRALPELIHRQSGPSRVFAR